MVARASALGLGGAVPPSDRVTVACIGAGWMGLNNVNSFLDEPGAQVVALCDIDREHLDQAQEAVVKKYGRPCDAYHNFEDVLARPDIDAVMLALPDHWHGVASVAAARAGKDIYGEKPLARFFAEGQAIVRAVERYGRVWQTGSWQRSETRFRRACEIVRNGLLGKVHRVEVVLPGGLPDFDNLGHLDQPTTPPPHLDYERWLGPAPQAPYCPARVHKTWRWNLDYGGGMLLDWVGHHVDIAHWALDLDGTGPVEVEGTGEFVSPNRVWNAPSAFRVRALYPNGLEMWIVSEDQDRPRGVKFIGEDGWLWVDRNATDAGPKSLLTARIPANGVRLEVSPGHYRQFLDCVRTRRRTLSPPDVALRSATPGYLGLIAILVGRKIRWDPVEQAILGDPEAARLLSRPVRGPWLL
jgi:predicted dehydrogenase